MEIISEAFSITNWKLNKSNETQICESKHRNHCQFFLFLFSYLLFEKYVINIIQTDKTLFKNQYVKILPVMEMKQFLLSFKGLNSYFSIGVISQDFPPNYFWKIALDMVKTLSNGEIIRLVYSQLQMLMSSNLLLRREE